MAQYQTLLVPYDFSEHARAALEAATDLADRFGAKVHLLHVIHLPAYAYGYNFGSYTSTGVAPTVDLSQLRADIMKSLSEVAASCTGAAAQPQLHVEEGAGIANSIVACAEEIGADMIVMGTHGRTGLAHVFLGSVAERTLRTAPCPVLSVRGVEEAEA